MIAGVLKKSGNDVLVVDYQFKPDSPSEISIVKKFKPDIIGITLYTATMKEADIIIDNV